MNLDMIKYILQTFFFQIVIGVGILAFLGVFVYAVSIENNNPPPADVKAQFQTSLGKPDGKNIADETISPVAKRLATQHMSSREVADLLNEIIVESFSFNASDYQRVIGKAASYFTPQGYDLYKTSLAESGLIGRVKAGGVQCGAFAESAPLEINSMVDNGVYKWRFQVPIMISLVPGGGTTLEPSINAQQNQRVILDVQFTRIDNPQNPGDIRIEFWQLKNVRR